MDRPEMQSPTRSSRDPEELRRRLVAWLEHRLPPGSGPQVPAVSTPAGSGMSSETLLFDATWTEGGGWRTGAFVARIAPSADDVPVFPTYDLEAQFRVLRLVAEHGVPVPRTRWLEVDHAPLGSPFFVMDRVEGRVPPDVMPYTTDGWLLEAAPEERRQLQDRTVEVLARLHAIDPHASGAAFLDLDVPGDTPLRRHVEHQRRYYEWVRGDRRHPLLERTFAWLEEHWPDEGDTVISWGDARIGNVLYDGFEPAAVLDWEMAALGPAEIDLGWMVFLHTFFEDIAHSLGLAGLPDMFRVDDVAATYAAASGKPVVDLPWYLVYAALRHGIVMARVHARQVHFGEAEWPDDPDDAVMHRGLLESMLDT